MRKTHRTKGKRIFRKIMAVLLAVVLILLAAVFFLWQDEIATVASLKMIRDRNDAHLDGAVYTMHVKGGFYLDDFVKQGGVKNDTELIRFVTKNITKGLIDIGISDPEIGCSAFTATTKDGDALLHATMTFQRPIPASFLPRRTRAAMLPFPAWTCSFWALMSTKTCRA